MDISKNNSRIAPLYQSDVSSNRDPVATEQNPSKGSKRRHATVYDAVAGIFLSSDRPI
jgi:hypothetical protein